MTQLHEAKSFFRKELRGLYSSSELYSPSDRRLSAKLVQPFADRWCRVDSATDPTAVNLGFLDRSRYFSIQVALSCPHEAEWTPFQTHYFSENLVAPGIKPETSGSVDSNSDH
jgi:hypothetical protein